MGKYQRQASPYHLEEAGHRDGHSYSPAHAGRLVRHTCAAWLVTSGVPLAVVRDLLGHSTIAMTERYAHLAPENVRSAVARLDEKQELKTKRPRHGRGR
ncbi:MAG: tyrosine-type recombinase/integrase [Pseudomonadota bacterium]